MKTFWKQAILFDLDGVLVDSRVPVERQWRIWSEEHGLDPEKVIPIAHGHRTIETVGLIAPGLDAAAEAAKIENREIADKDGLLAIAGAREILSRIPAGRWAIVTSGGRALATARLQHVGIPVPPVLVSADDVSQGKPDPAPYLMGARGIGFAPRDCLVIEDSPSGILSACAAGMEVIGIPTTYSREQIEEADAIAESLGAIGVEVDANGMLRIEVA